MKIFFRLSIVFALACLAGSVCAEIHRKNKGVQKIIPGNQITVSGNGTGIVSVGVGGAISVDTNTLRLEVNALHVDSGTFKTEVNSATNTLRTEVDALHVDSGTFKTEVNASTGSLRTEVNALHVDSGTFKAEVNASTNALNTAVISKSGPIIFDDEGTGLSTATRVNCAGTGIACTNVGSTITITVAGGAAVTNSTSIFIMTIQGGVAPASTTFVSFPGKAWSPVFHATWTISAVRGFCHTMSTNTWTGLNIAFSTGTGALPFAYRFAPIKVGTGTTFDQWVSTAARINYNETIALHATHVPSTQYPAAENCGVEVMWWKEPEPVWP